MTHSVVIFGGTGFVGSEISRRLDELGHTVRVISRNIPDRSDIEILTGDPEDERFLDSALEGCDVAIQLIGILNESGHDGRGFDRVHTTLARKIAAACSRNGIHRLLHMSALHAHASEGTSFYLRSKGAGEDAAHELGNNELQVTSFRPSVIFGPDDSFINRFAGLIRFTPGFFPLACPDARFAPVYVGDVAQTFIDAIDDSNTFSRRIDLCGPEIFTLREIVQYTSSMLGRRVYVIGLPDWVSRLQASMLEYFPGKPFSLDNYRSLQTDSVCDEKTPCQTKMCTVVPTYVEP